jgi:hypothetical protein
VAPVRLAVALGQCSPEAGGAGELHAGADHAEVALLMSGPKATFPGRRAFAAPAGGACLQGEFAYSPVVRISGSVPLAKLSPVSALRLVVSVAPSLKLIFKSYSAVSPLSFVTTRCVWTPGLEDWNLSVAVFDGVPSAGYVSVPMTPLPPDSTLPANEQLAVHR